MLMELNDRCEDYGLKININKTKAMVIGRKPKKIDIRIKDESIEQMDSFKYLGCNISSSMNCCQEVNREQQWQRSFEQGEKHFQRTLVIRNKEEASVECNVVWCRELDTTTE